MRKLQTEIFKHNHMNFICALLGSILHTMLIMYTSFLLMDFTNTAIAGDMEGLKQLFLRVGIFLITYMGCHAFASYFKNACIKKGMLQFKKIAFARVLNKPIATFQKEHTSDYISAFTNDMNRIENDYVEGLFEVMVHVILFVGSLLCMAYLHGLLTILILCSCLLPLCISIVFGKSITNAEAQTSIKNAHYTNVIKDFLSGFSVIKSFQSEKEFIENFSKEAMNLEQEKLHKRNLIAIVEVIAGGCGLCVNFVIFGMGAYLSIQGEMSAGTMIAFVQLSSFVIQPLQTLPSLLSNLLASKALIDKMEMCCQEEVSTVSEKKVFEREITMRDVSFAYQDDAYILKDINLTFEKGKSYAIVGGSGSGKSTLVKLLMGYYKCDGSIQIDTISIQEISCGDIYEMMSLIQQNVFLFDDTLKHNITMCKHFASNDLACAIHRAGLHTLWDEKGDDYGCGENGNCLSGGEKQRVSIARSLLKKTPILLMDEGTSSLDVETATQIENAILSIEDKTKIVITHRLQKETLQRFDEIIVLNNHTVIEQGNFHALYAQKGCFYSLYQIQNA